MLGIVYIFSTPLDLISLPVGSPSTILGALFLALWILELLRGRVSLPRHPWALAAGVGFVLWSAVTTTWSVVPSITASQSLSTGLLLLSAIAIASSFPDQLRGPAWALLLGSFLLASLTLVLGGQQVYYIGTTELQSQQHTLGSIDENALSLHLMLGFAAGLFLMRRQVSARLKIGIVLMVGVLVVTTILVGSRSALGSMIGMIVLLVLMSAKRVSALVWSVLLIAISLLPIKILADAGMIPDRIVQWVSNPVASDSRTEIIAMYKQFMGDWFWGGVGAGGDAYYLQSVASSFQNAHSAFWKTWIETGIVGLVLWLAFVVASAIIAIRSHERDFFLLAGVPILIYFYTLGPVNSNMLWAVFGLALGMPAVAKSVGGRGRPTVPA